MAGIICSTITLTYSARRPRYSIGTSCAPMKVAVRSTGWPADSVLIARRIRRLRGELEAVAALGLRRRGAVGEHLRQPLAPEFDEIVFARLARRGDGLDDAAAGRGDVGIGVAGQAATKLVAAIAGEDKMCVRIDEAGDDGAAFTVDDLGVGSECDRSSTRQPRSR